jgi:hypothetical protein
MEPTIYKPSIYKGAGIYKIGAEGGGGGGDLPEGYTPAIYARANGSVSLEFTGLNVNYNDKFVIELDLKIVQQGSLGFKASNNSARLYPDIGVVSDSSFIPRYSYSTNITSSTNWLDYSNGGLIKITCNKRYCTIDCEVSNYHKTIDRNTTAADSIIDTIQLFAWSSGGYNYPFNGTIYSMKVYDKDNPDKLNADFVPCSNENNVLGFYEKISGQFQGSANIIE